MRWLVFFVGLWITPAGILRSQVSDSIPSCFAELKHTIEAELAISLSLERLFGADIDGIAEDVLGQIETASCSTDATGSLTANKRS